LTDANYFFQNTFRRLLLLSEDTFRYPVGSAAHKVCIYLIYVLFVFKYILFFIKLVVNIEVLAATVIKTIFYYNQQFAS